MDANKYTKKSLEAVQNAQNTAMEYGNAELTCTHLADALLEKDGMCYRILRPRKLRRGRAFPRSA